MQQDRVQIGVVGVDSGQLIVADPCYVDSEWTHLPQAVIPVPGTIFRDQITKRTYAFIGHGLADGVHVDVLFENFEQPLADYDGLTANQVRDKGVWKEESAGADHQGEFDYRGVCHTTLKGKFGSGQLMYKRGHAGVGVACGGFGGDGVYPVYVELDSDGMVRRLTVEFQEE